MDQPKSRQRRVLQIAGVAVIAGLLLATGGFIGNAMADDSDAPSEPASQANSGTVGRSTEGNSGGDLVTSIAPRPGAATNGPFRPTDPDDGGEEGVYDLSIGRSPGYYNQCPGTLAEVATGGNIDLVAAGLSPQFLSSRFVLQSLSLRADADCDDPSQQFVSLDTGWQTDDGFFQVWITQRESNDPVASILYDTWAEFWRDGYYYSVSVSQAYPVMTFAPTSGGTAEETIEPAFAENTAEVSALLRDVVEELTGDATLQCFYRQTEGGWDALTELGIGDPRGAIPQGFQEDNVYAQVFEAPGADCELPAEVELPISFSANWTDGDDGWLSFSVYQANSRFVEGAPIGWSSEYGVSWSNGSLQFEVNGNRRDGGIGLETLEAMAQVVDPAFHQSCRLTEREFTQSELASAGIGWPVAPDGYSPTEVYTSGSEPTASCDSSVGQGYFSANWSFEGDDGAMLHASAWVDSSLGVKGEDGGSIGDGFMHWQSAGGVFYTVESWNQASGDGDGDRDAMVALALSLDPGIDIDSLTEEVGGGRPPIAIPVEEDGGDGSQGSSTASE